jgi:hypothetical protein
MEISNFQLLSLEQIFFRLCILAEGPNSNSHVILGVQPMELPPDWLNLKLPCAMLVAKCLCSFSLKLLAVATTQSTRAMAFLRKTIRAEGCSSSAGGYHIQFVYRFLGVSNCDPYPASSYIWHAFKSSAGPLEDCGRTCAFWTTHSSLELNAWAVAKLLEPTPMWSYWKRCKDATFICNLEHCTGSAVAPTQALLKLAQTRWTNHWSPVSFS